MSKPDQAVAGNSSRPTESNEPRFSRDVAPILVANCVGCHTSDGAGLRRGKLDLMNFESLMKGTPDHPVIVAGKPEESHLYLRVHGDEEPAMPQGGDRRLSEAAVSRIERWIKAGALLDPGLDATASFSVYAATPAQLRNLELAALSEEARLKLVLDAARERFKQANPALEPEHTSGEHFVLFGNLPKDRAARVLGVLDTQYANLKKLLGGAAPNWPEKVGLYIFKDRRDLIEFIRTVEDRDVDTEVRSTARLSVSEPYVAVLDSSRDSEPSSALPTRRGSRVRKGDNVAKGRSEDRALAAELTESFATAAVRSAGNPPAWLSSGIGVSLASRIDPQGQEFKHLRQLALQAAENGWEAKASDVLNDSPAASMETRRAVGSVLVEWLLASGRSRRFPEFAAALIEKPARLTELLGTVYGSSREQFIAGAGRSIVYGPSN